MSDIPSPEYLTLQYSNFIEDGWFGSKFMETLNLLTLCVIDATVEAGDTCIDAGANLGVISKAMKNAVGDIGNVICVEPNPNLAKELMNHDYYVVEAALMEYFSGERDFFLPENPDHWDLGSIESNYLEKYFPQLDQGISKIKVKATTLDRILKKCNHVKFLKLDIEGLDEQVLLGASNMKEMVDLIEWEHNYEVSGEMGRDLYVKLRTEGFLVFDCFFNELSPVTCIEPHVAPINRYAVREDFPKLSFLKEKIDVFWAANQDS